MFVFSFSQISFMVLFVTFLVFAVLSTLANGLLLFLIVRYKELLWQPLYILLKNISVCGLGLTSVTTLVLLSSLIQEQTQVYGHWCIVQFSILRCFFLMSQMTLALMAIERYIFICRGIHYVRVINSTNIHVSLGVTWLLSLGVSVHGGLVLSHTESSFQQPTKGLVCDAVTIKEHIVFSREENLQVFGPPSIITSVCILSICCCYGCMYHAALRVSTTLRCSNHRANRTVGYYFLMFLLQLILNILFIIFTLIGKTKAGFYEMTIPILTPLLIIIPPFIIATFLLLRNKQIRHILRSACQQKCQFTVRTEVEELELREEELAGAEHGGAEISVISMTPVLPGFVSSPSSDNC